MLEEYNSGFGYHQNRHGGDPREAMKWPLVYGEWNGSCSRYVASGCYCAGGLHSDGPAGTLPVGFFMRSDGEAFQGNRS